MANQVIASVFTAVAQGASGFIQGKFNVSIRGNFVGTVFLQRSFDNGVTWQLCTGYNNQLPSAGFTIGVSFVCEEPEDGVLYRFNCTQWTSGTITTRISQ